MNCFSCMAGHGRSLSLKSVSAYLLVALCMAIGMAGVCRAAPKPIIERLVPIPKNSGFKMEGWFVWGGSVIKVGDTFHLFASRWPEETTFPNGYRSHSEIVRATAKDPTGPYAFEEVVLSGRKGEWWDGKMCHNPKIVQSGDTYVLYYIGSRVGGRLRKCGYAWSKSIEGPWTRCEEPLPFGKDHNNPAPYVHEDGRILLAFRDLNVRMHLAEADRFDGAYKIVARSITARSEDPDLYRSDGTYHLTVSDLTRKLTGMKKACAHLVSRDGIHWEKHASPIVFTRTMHWADGTTTEVQRRERAELFNAKAQRKGNGDPTHLLTAVLVDGKTWCQVQEIAPPRK